jgi:hypothetical protein
MGLYLQQRLVDAIHRARPNLSGRGIANELGLKKDSVARWLSGADVMNLAEVAAFAHLLGADVLASIPAGELLPPAYAALLRVGINPPQFQTLTEPAWTTFADIVCEILVREHASHRIQLLTAPVLAHSIASAADRMPPTAAVVDVEATDANAIIFRLPEVVELHVALITDAMPPEELSGAVLWPLRVSRSPEHRHVNLFALGRRAAAIADQLIRSRDGGPSDHRFVTSVDMARAGIGEVADLDLELTLLAEAFQEPFTVRALEVQKA